ncbi:Uncharacterised protein [Escherichia coli]|uniref:Uncharacterized protein n=1 Tax=Escherichia coli TaxID=562 RepID=A0A376WYN9_ECOLX|nr:Uncharacterised protein [Escherichia coli]
MLILPKSPRTPSLSVWTAPAHRRNGQTFPANIATVHTNAARVSCSIACASKASSRGSKIFPVGWSGLEEVKNLSYCHRADTHHRGFYRWRFLKIAAWYARNTHPQHAIPVVITVYRNTDGNLRFSIAGVFRLRSEPAYRAVTIFSL